MHHDLGDTRNKIAEAEARGPGVGQPKDSSTGTLHGPGCGTSRGQSVDGSL